MNRSPKGPGVTSPLLPLSGLPPSPERPERRASSGRRQRARRTLLIGLVAFCLVNGAWGSRALYRAWQARGQEWQQAAGPSPSDAAGREQHAARQHAASAANNAAVAAMDAAQAVSSAAGAAKHGAQAAGQAVGAALITAAPAAAKAAAAVGGAAQGAAAKTRDAAQELAASLKEVTAASSTTQAGPVGQAKQAEGQEKVGNGGRPPAELTPPDVAAASNDTCAQALGIKKVALMFLTRGEMHHEPAWRRWFAGAAGRLPARALETAMCGGNDEQQQEQRRAIQQACTPRQPQVSLAAGAGAAVAAAASGVSAGALEAAQRQAVGLPPAEHLQEQHLFSVYIHAPPDFSGYPAGSLWEGRLIPRRIQTGWGEISLVEATRNLLWEAFKDPLNERFVLLSESDVPLYDPLTFHQQLLAESKSKINACFHSGRHEWRWSGEMETEHMKADHWRKSTQWIELTREHVEAVLRDVEVFEKECWSNWVPERSRWRDCFPDEHYFATLLAVLGKDEETYCDSWGVAAQDWSQGGAHPRAFRPSEVTPALLRSLREPDKCDGEAAYADAQRMYVDASAVLGPDREGSCQLLRDASKAASYAHPLPGICHLTARKFPSETRAAVSKLFSPGTSCSTPAHSSSSPTLLLSEHYCRLQQAA